MRTSLVANPMSSAFAKAACLTGYILLSLGLSPQAFAADADDAIIEEVVVTGSYLKRNVEDSPSVMAPLKGSTIQRLIVGPLQIFSTPMLLVKLDI